MIAGRFLVAITILLILTTYLSAQSSFFKYGLDFGIGRKDSKKILENEGYEILDENKVSKHLRTFAINGILYANLSKQDGSDNKTELDFYEDKLMNVTLFSKSKDYFSHNDSTNSYLSQLVEQFGKPSTYENVMSIKSWMWLSGNNKILLNSDSRKKTTKISFIYRPLSEEKYEDFVEVQLKGKPVDPAKEMFLK